ncbi:MAG: nicotinamide-nucleotide amidohydrolase family protein, partial [Planctomycetota bacterium]|nr:nicotinamide-nucleotide amidohydrolase family protein [Planctomycetota bacterium]
TAPGLAGTIGECLVFALPGPPREMKPMFRDYVLPDLHTSKSDQVLVTRTIHSFGIGEALAAEQLGDLLERDSEPVVGITASESTVTARIRSHGRRAEAEAEVDAIARRVEAAWAPFAYGHDDDTLPIVVGRLLESQGLKLSTAESCTGGWLGKLLVDVPGSSAYYEGGWVTYTNELKKKCLAVPASILDGDGSGAVSGVCAKLMAEGALHQSGASVSLAITGIAGPDGDTPGKPVGTVFIAMGRQVDDHIDTTVRHFEFSGNRSTIRHRAAQAALQMLRLNLLGFPDSGPMLWERIQPSETIQG